MGALVKVASGPVAGAAAVLAACALLLAASSASAASPLKVREVFPGSSTHGAGAEYVVLQMTGDGQNDIDGQTLQFFDADGDFGSAYVIPADVANGGSQRTVLLATQKAAGEGVVAAPDFDLGADADRMSPGGGGVCLTGASPPDCVTWGTIPLATVFNPYLPDPQSANAAAVPDGLSLRRSIDPGCGTYLEVADDSGSSAADFAPLAPFPRNNASSPLETRCAPDTVLNTFPANPTNQTSAAFTYAAAPAEPGVSFQCRIDGEPFAPCPGTGKTYPGPLPEGIHTFAVKAIGEGGEDPTPRTFAWAIDAKAPDTAIDSFPPEPSGGFEARFTYSSSEPSSSFRCQLDDGPVQLCAPGGKTYFQLADGAHVFRVWAVDNAGNQDPTPAERIFTVRGVLIDVTQPDTSIVFAPANPSSTDSASFRYSSSEPGSAFECSLNDSPFASCPASGISYSRLRNGVYLFAVRAIDPAGNVDSVAATYSWAVAAPLPKVTFVKAPAGNVRMRKGAKASLLFKFKADKPGSSFRCRLDKRPFGVCPATTTVRASAGRHRFEVYAVDELGNVGDAVSRRIVRVVKPRRGGFF